MAKNEKDLILKVQGASVSRGDNMALRDFSWSVRRGEHWAILGPNGSGKSTLVQVLQGWLWPQSGEVSVLGRSFGEDDVDELRRHVAWVGSEVEPEFPAHQTVSDLVVSGAVGTLGIQFDSPSSGQRAAGRRALSLLRLTHLAKRPFNKLSQGQRRLAVIARALAMGPELLLLDEATSGLDPVARERFLERIQNLLVQKSDLGTRRNFTPRSFPHSFPLVIYITHHLEEILPGFTHVLLLREGKVVAAGPRKQVLTDELLEKTFAARFTLVSRGGRLWASIRKGSNT